MPLYVIIQGEVDIVVDPSLVSITEEGIENKVIAIMRRGQSFGEVALVDEGLRSASACASQKDTRLFIIPRDKLIMLCETYPQLGISFNVQPGGRSGDEDQEHRSAHSRAAVVSFP